MISLTGREEHERWLFWFTVAAGVFTFWLNLHPPMYDLPQHAGQIASLRDIFLGQFKWHEIAYVDFYTPYLLGYIPGALLALIMPVEYVLALMLSLSFIGSVIMGQRFLRHFGGVRELDWLLIPAYFGFAWHWGFFTLLMAVQLAFWVMILGDRYAAKPSVRTGLILLIWGGLLFISHAIMFLFCCMVCGVLLLARFYPFTLRLTGKLALALVPYMLFGVLLLAYVLADGGIGIIGGYFEFGASPFTRLIHIPMTLLGSDRSQGYLLLAMTFLAAPFFCGFRFRPLNSYSTIPAWVLLSVWLVTPIMLCGTYYMYNRFSIFILPFYILLFRADVKNPFGSSVGRLMLIGGCWCLLLFHAERLLLFKEESHDFEQVMRELEPGHRSLMLLFDMESPMTGGAMTYISWPAWYQARTGGWVDFNMAEFQPQIIKFKPGQFPVADNITNQRAVWFNWNVYNANIYKYFFVRSTGPILPEVRQQLLENGRCEVKLRAAAGTWSVFERFGCKY